MSDKKSLKIAKGGKQEPKIKQGQTTMVGWCMVLNATFSNISVYIVAVSFIGGGNRWKPATCCKSLTNLSGIRTHNINGDGHWLHG